MKARFFMGAMLFGAFTLSCSQQDDLIDSISENTIEYQVNEINSNTDIVTKDDAIFIATKFLNRLQTKSTQSEAEPFYSSTHEQIGYIVNFPESGFCIISSSKDLPPILAYSDNGYFESKNIDKIGISTWIENLSQSKNILSNEEKEINRKLWNYYKSSTPSTIAFDNSEKTAALNKRINEINQEFNYSAEVKPLIAYKGTGIISDSSYEMFKNKGGSEEYTIVVCNKKNIGAEVKPLLKTRWYQEGAFGKYATNGYAGCTVIAAGQLMNYFRYPKTYNWDAISMNNYNNEAVSLLSKDIQDKFNVKYGKEGTASTISDVKRGLEKFGYTVKQTSDPLSYNFIRKNHQPFYEQGCNDANEGHAWVVDGYKSFDYQYELIVEYQRENSGSFYYERDNTTYLYNDGSVVSTLTHYNWGWGGTEDGYYYEPKYKKNVKQLILSKP